MGLSPIISAGLSSTSIPALTTVYHPIINGGTSSVAEATESDAQVRWRTPGILSNLWVVVIINSRGASTAVSRINGVSGNQVVSIPATTTGTFEDSINSDAIAAGDLLTAQLTTGAGGGAFNYTVIGALFLPSNAGDTLTKHGKVFQETRTGGALTRYYTIQDGGSNGGSATEADVKYKIQTAGTWKNLNVHVTANTRAGATTYRSRKNTAYGNQLISVGAGATGIFEDTVNTDTVTVADLLDVEYVQAAGGGSLTIQSQSSELICPNAGYHLICGSSVFATYVAGGTSYAYIAGSLAAPSTTETDVQTKVGIVTVLSNLFVYVVNNNVTTASTVRTRKNAADGNQLVSIGAGVTGIFEDTVNSDILTATDKVNYQIIVGASALGTNIQPTLIGVLGLAQAIVTTTAASNITDTTADSGGTVIDGGASVTARGVAYNTTGTPDIVSDPFTVDGSGNGGFVSNLTPLLPGTTYFVRAYATNLAGTIYGNEISFTTLALPTVTTDVITAITSITATGGGNVTSDGGSAVTVRGVCWSIVVNPTTADSCTTDGAGVGIFVSSLTGLLPNTLYHVRAYATNSVGTAYGDDVTFMTEPSGAGIVIMIGCCKGKK